MILDLITFITDNKMIKSQSDKMIGCIIQARMGSTRLPGKVLKDAGNNKPVLYYIIDQLQHCKSFSNIVVATTTLDEDDPIVQFCNDKNIVCFRGNPTDVLDRYYQCAKKYSFSTIMRMPSDKPLLDPELVDRVISFFNNNNYDYVTTFLILTFPIGTEVEVFSFEALELAWKNAKLPSEKEHVTPYFYNNPTLFKIFNIQNQGQASQMDMKAFGFFETLKPVEISKRLKDIICASSRNMH